MGNEDSDPIYDGLTKEEFQAQQEFEERVMNSFFERAPVEVQMGGKTALLGFLAETMVELYEGKKR